MRTITRRTMLRGLGAAMTLPLLESVCPVESVGAVVSPKRSRVAYLYFPNGTPEGTWEPEEVGRDGELKRLNRWMAPLEPFKKQILIPENVWTPSGNGHGAGTATWLTGSSYDGRTINAGGISVDQIAARSIGRETLLPSLELSVKGQGYFSNDLPRNSISWTAPGTPAGRDVVPRTIYDRMFRRGEEGFVDRSVIDLVLGQAKSLRLKVSRLDQQKIDEYLDAARSIEKRIEFAEKNSNRAQAEGVLTDSLTRPEPGIPTDHGEYLRLMMDLIVMGFWANATRVATFMLDHGQSNRYFNFVDGVEGTWHALSHYKDISGRTEDDDGKTSWKTVGSKKEMYAAVNHWHHQQVAYLLGRMNSIKEEGATLLENSMVLYGSSLSDGHEHSERNLPLLLAGGGGGTIRSGRVLKHRRETSMSGLHLAMLQRLGINLREFADSDSPLAL